MKSKRILLVLNPFDLEAIKLQAQKEQLSVNAFIRKCISEYCNKEVIV